MLQYKSYVRKFQREINLLFDLTVLQSWSPDIRASNIIDSGIENNDNLCYNFHFYRLRLKT